MPNWTADIDGEKLLNSIINKIHKQEELDEMDAYYLALLPFFKNEKSREEMLEHMCHFIIEIEISEELKYIIKLVQILSVNALFSDEKQEEFLGVVKMRSTYIARYERNLIKNAANDAVKTAKEEIALKMKADGFAPDVIFKYCGIMLYGDFSPFFLFFFDSHEEHFHRIVIHFQKSSLVSSISIELALNLGFTSIFLA